MAHQRYKDLAQVEYGFRTIKTGLWETRPVYVRKEERTRAHVFVVMLSYIIVHELRTDVPGRKRHNYLKKQYKSRFLGEICSH